MPMKRALVLCGGGSLGSYEVGVWRYLREKKIDFDIIVGTSIGAINGAMIAVDAYDEAVKMWESVSVGKIMANGMNIDLDFPKKISFKKDSQFYTFFRSYMKHRGADIAPFAQLLKDVVLPLNVASAKKTLGMVVGEYPSMKEKDFIINGQDDDFIMDALLGTSACFPVFPIYQGKDKKYIDGGWRNNLPIDFALRLGAEEIIAVRLNSLPYVAHPELMDLPNVTMIEPHSSQGSMLVFEQKPIRRNMEMGYLDAKNVFGETVGFAYHFFKEPCIKKEVAAHLKIAYSLDPNLYGKAMDYLGYKKRFGKEKDGLAFYLMNLERLLQLFGFDPVKTDSLPLALSELVHAIKHYRGKNKDKLYWKNMLLNEDLQKPKRYINEYCDYVIIRYLKERK